MTNTNNTYTLKTAALVVLLPAALASPARAMDKDDPLLAMLKVDQLEYRQADKGDDATVLAADAWIGQDLNKLVVKTDLERSDGETEEAELQLLYSRAISPFWDAQVGVRKDFEPTPERSWAVFGFTGLAPYLFESEAMFYVGESGRTALQLSLEYELLFTQKLILSPELELNFYGHNDEDTGVGSGLSDVEFGLRLRYEFHRQFAPYIGVNWTGMYGQTADYAREEGEEVRDWQWVAGIRAWF